MCVSINSAASAVIGAGVLSVMLWGCSAEYLDWEAVANCGVGSSCGWYGLNSFFRAFASSLMSNIRTHIMICVIL